MHGLTLLWALSLLACLSCGWLYACRLQTGAIARLDERQQGGDCYCSLQVPLPLEAAAQGVKLFSDTLLVFDEAKLKVGSPMQGTASEASKGVLQFVWDHHWLCWTSVHVNITREDIGQVTKMLCVLRRAHLPKALAWKSRSSCCIAAGTTQSRCALAPAYILTLYAC